MTTNQSTQAWLDRFFDYYFRFHPVSATFIGVHQYDESLPSSLVNGDWTEQIAELESLLSEHDKLRDVSSNDSSQELDRLLARSFLVSEFEELRGTHFSRNPCWYTGEAIFGIVSLFLRDYAALDVRLSAASIRLSQIPALLEAGEAAVSSAPIAWVERAINECDGAEKLLLDGLPLLLSGSQIDQPDITKAVQDARGAFARFRTVLADRKATEESEHYAVGEAEFDRLLREQHFLDMTGRQIASYARGELAASRRELNAAISAAGYSDWEQVAEALAAEHPSVDGYLPRFQEVWDAAKQHAIDNELLTWPDFPIVFEPIPDWAQSAAPHLYFLFYRCPPAVDDGQIQRYLVTPIAGKTPELQQQVLRAVNESQITLNHVIHHGGIGHHVQNWHAARSSSRIAQMAGNDCAMRIAISSAGTYVEGWACYVTDLMDEAGFLTPLQKLSMPHSRMRMAARAIVDVELHSGRFTFDEAVAFYVDEVDMTPQAARSEVVKNSMFPSMAMMYLIGTDLIHDLRAELQEQWGSEFSLRRFHDEFLSWGAVPVTLVARLIRGERLAAGRFSRGHQGWSEHVANRH